MKLTFLLAFILLGVVSAGYDSAGYYYCQNESRQPPHYMCDNYCDCSSNTAYGNGAYCEDEDAEICADAGGDAAEGDAAEGDAAAADDDAAAADDDAAEADDAAEDAAEEEDSGFYCADGDSVPSHYVCDNDCDCVGCEDEEFCEDGLGVTKINLGNISMRLNLKQGGGQYGVMTTQLIQGIFYCILHPGDCF
ncbi:low-density lipoprotein receptor-related protein 2-like [Bolinopsis microptera]|uniref:low-density lipoprotein receptor-related protein 2-like n=1 Tax=Bolinopsis microptera TaxID=2820187 RepID=UPI00307A5DCD